MIDVSLGVKILIIVGAIALFFLVTILNLKTKKPEGCENEQEECKTCSYKCIHNMNQDAKKDK